MKLPNGSRVQTQLPPTGDPMSTPKMIDGCYFGFCPTCGAPGVWRERRPNGDDVCASGHTYPSAKAVMPNMEAKPNADAPTIASIQAELAKVREELAAVRKELAEYAHARRFHF